MSTTPVLHQSAPAAMSEEWWAATERTANRLANVSWIPEVYRRKPADIMAAGLALATIGRDLTPMTLKLVYVVNGTVDFMVDLIVAQVHEHGHEMWVEESDETHATVAGQRGGSDRVHRATFTIEQARAAGLVGKDVWKRYVNDMLVARAAKRCAKRVCPEALLAMPPPINYVVTESGRIQVTEIAHVDQDGEIVDDDVIDGEIVENPQPASAQIPEGSESRARTGPAVAPAHPGGAVSASDPAAPSGHDEQDEVYANRRRRANAAMGEVGVKTDDGRHELVGTATGGATRSTGRLTAWQVVAPVVAFCDRLKADETDESGGEVDNAGAAVVGASTAPPSSGPVIDQIKAMARAKGVTQADVLRKAQELAVAAGLPTPAALSELDELTESDLADWLGEG